jgi:CBS domain-containing protein
MKVGELMSRNVRTCLPTDSINDAARIMWDSDCGCVPVVRDDGKVVGMITDRDICMAAYTQGRSLMHMTVESAASKSVVTVGEDEILRRAAELMRGAQVRRLPVVDGAGKLVGLLSLADFARRAPALAEREWEDLVAILAGLSQPRSAGADEPSRESRKTESHGVTDLKNELKKGLAQLRTLRDEVRVQLHLGSRELKDQWKRLEPHLGDVEKKAEELTEASRGAVLDAVKRLESLRSSLLQHN